MKPEALFTELEALMTRLGVTIREERLGASGPAIRGGLCRVKGEWFCILDSKSPLTEKNDVLARGLARLDLEGTYVKPGVREYINGFLDGPADAEKERGASSEENGEATVPRDEGG